MIIAFSGRIGKDAETRTTQGGETVTSFSVGCNTGRDKTTWVSCAIFGERGTKLAPYLLKGTPVGIHGFPSVRAWKDQSGEARPDLQCAVHHVDLLGSKSDGQRDDNRGGGYGGGGYGGSPAPQGGPSDLDDSIPFGPEVR